MAEQLLHLIFVVLLILNGCVQKTKPCPCNRTNEVPGGGPGKICVMFLSENHHALKRRICLGVLGPKLKKLKYLCP